TLAQVDVDIRRFDASVTGTLLFDVRATTAGGAPIENNAAALAAVSIPAASVPVTLGFFSVDVSAFGIPVTPGEVLAIVLREVGGPDIDYIWSGGVGNPYPAGAEYFRNPTGGFPTWTLSSDGNPDLGFKTFVTVPAPSAAVLFSMGLGALASVTW